ncbi:spermatogenesis-associated protein 17 isoform X2 [Anguilla anguilla]|uniref:spermatogenesis-associated protein 17 isoform X2 n=1 Tax=Anguilla anguilla TaxID=7936 RepID=UPI0015AAF76B|nr:spermatogenesis-associated protein 17 isoform X2 [Anguilla anguilla]
MASFVRLQDQFLQIKEEFFRRNRIAEDYRYKENLAAIQIQSWFRGCQVRVYLRQLHRNATIIQKVWQGYTARACFRQMTAYFMMKMHFYNEMAVRIQQRWRGYYVRKYIHNYHARQQYLEGLARKNEQIRRDLEEFGELQRRAMEHSNIERDEREKQDQAQRMHYLLSTHQCPGVFNSPFRGHPHEMELRMRCIRPLLIKAVPRKKPINGDHNQSIPEASLDLCASQPLPPIPSKKPQGPFRKATEVNQQRYRPLEPTLRVATSITALEEVRKDLFCQEWTGHISAQPFQLFSNADKNRKYEGMIHTGTLYGKLDYGSKHFRETNMEILQGKVPFKTVFTTSHVFDKFGRLYSNAGKIVTVRF